MLSERITPSLSLETPPAPDSKNLHSCSPPAKLIRSLSQGDFDFGDNVDKATFEQILDMDEEDDRDFSKSIVFGFLEQAEQTFGKMDAAL